MNYLWLFAVAGGAIILGLVLAFAAMKTRDRTPAEAARGKAKTREMYQERDDETNPLEAVVDNRVTKPSEHQATVPSHSGTPTAEPPQPGTSDDRPRWEGPAENRPRGYKPAIDDPSQA